jgi:hypothetical protein
MRAWVGWGFVAALACWSCAGPAARPDPGQPVEPGKPEPQVARFRAAVERMPIAQLESMLGAQPTKSLPVGEEHALVVWSFERRFSELDSPVVHVVALADRKGWIDWWYQVPAPLAYICFTEGCPLCSPTRVLLPLVDGEQSPREREQTLRLAGFLTP